MSAETAATPPPVPIADVDQDQDQAPVEKNVITDPATAAILAEFAAFRADADAALEDARRRREAAPAEVAAAAEARRRAAEVERAARAGWADDD